MCRTQRGASQTEVANRANCSVSYLSMLENNKRDPKLSTITRIAQALHVPVGVLLFLAAEKDELGQMDARLAGEVEHSALASLRALNDEAARG